MEGMAARADGGSLGSRVGLALRDIKLAHSVFAMPFAVLGAFLVTPALRGGDGGGGWGRFGGQLALVAACMVCARTWAMLVNRVADRRLDAANPRTAQRAVASGRLRTRDAVAMGLVAGAGFVACCGAFLVWFENAWPLWLSVPTLVWVGFYSFTKRFTWGCHLFLGGALGASPIAAGIAVDPRVAVESGALWWLAAMVVCWVGGFDVLYALQDEGHDREVGLSSVPARWGGARARWISRGLHGAAIVCLAMVWREDDRFGVLFGLGVVGAGGLLVWEHVHLWRRGIAGLPLVFGFINGVVALMIGTVGCVDLLS